MKKASIMSRLRRRLDIHGPGVTIGVIALVIALAGGAYAAAKGGLTSKQKKQVQSIAKTEASKYANSNPGAPGAIGSQGPKGDQGSAGKNGAPGQDGENGKSVIVTAVPTGSPICNELGGAEVEEEGGSSSVEICNGITGQDAGFNYHFDSGTTVADPGAGNLALDNVSPEAATTISVSNTDSNENELKNVVAGWGQIGPGATGTLLIRKVGKPTVFAEYTVTANKVGAGETFRSLSVALVASKGVFADEDPITVAYWASSSKFLAPGAVETGTWAFTGTEANENGIRVPLSFTIPLKSPLGAESVHVLGEPGFATVCSGNESNPNPAPGQLCVYPNAFEEFPAVNTTIEGIFPATNPTSEVKGADRLGALLRFAKPTGIASGSGVYAVKGF